MTPARASSPGPDAGPAHILVIDDEQDIREMLELSLSLEGFAVSCADGGELGLSIARERRVDLVICDIKMPGLDGIETIRRLRRMVPGIPVIVATGYLTPDTIESCEALGVTQLLRKPFPLRELDAAVGAILGRDT